MIYSKVKLFIYKTKRKYNRFFSWISYRGFKKYDLIIFDDIYPHPMSGFRLEEFTVLLEEFKNSKIIIDPTAYSYLNIPLSTHKEHLCLFLKDRKHLRGKIDVIKKISNINCRLFYCVFFGTIYKNLDRLEKYKIPFVFTLYPGGGFIVDDEITNKKMKQVFSSPMFKHVIVTQKFTREYLIINELCPIEKIKFIFGGVVPQNSLLVNMPIKKVYVRDKATFDLCFCATKYMSLGSDKGYDLFIEAAHKLAEKFDFVRFHIIGGFSSKEIDCTVLGDKIKFYGYQNFENLSEIYQMMDVLVSPNRPFVLTKGGFDGFPLGTAVEAGLNGVAVIVSDCLKQNSVFVKNEEIIIIENTVESIEKAVVDLINNPEKLDEISKKGREKFLNVYSNKVQMQLRIKLLKSLIDG